MKTREEMIYDFMLALASNSAYYIEDMKMSLVAKGIHAMASELANNYLENLG